MKIPIFNLAAKEDHIAPARSVFDGSKAFGGKVDYVMAGSGHIAGVVNPMSKPKYQFWTGGPPKGKFEDWVAKAEEHPGSWWPYWFAWVEKQTPGARPGPRARRRQAHPALRRAGGIREGEGLRRLVIPGPREARNPEPINTSGAEAHNRFRGMTGLQTEKAGVSAGPFSSGFDAPLSF